MSHRLLPYARLAIAWTLTVFLPVSVAACGETASPEEGLVFPKDLAGAGFVQVRACRAPGEHSALGGFTVWVDPESHQAFEELWADPPRRTELPGQTVIVKETYQGPECASGDVFGWLAMKKEPGFDPDHGDWYWQEVTRAGEVRTDGRESGCTSCHRGADNTTCIGYGADHGRDYVCTEP
jgi:hypothetical protein